MATFTIPEDKRIALVDTETWLFPVKTLEALRIYLEREQIDPAVIYDMVQEALGEHQFEMRVAFGELEYRTDPAEPWHTVLQLQDIVGAIQAGIAGYERHEFTSAVGQWSFQHSLGRVPAVSTYSAAGERILGDEVATAGSVTVTWAVPTSGFAILT